jgi:hypothetical protein
LHTSTTNGSRYYESEAGRGEEREEIMRTWQAALSHIAVSSLQVVAAVPFFSQTSFGGTLANTYIQSGTQVGLAALQYWIANKNSKTAPNGQPLVETSTGNFISLPTTKP